MWSGWGWASPPEKSIFWPEAALPAMWPQSEPCLCCLCPGWTRLSAHGSPGSIDPQASLSVGTAESDASIFTKFKVRVDSKGLRLVPGSESLLVLM